MAVINDCPAIMTSEPLSTGGSPALLHRSLLTPHVVLRSTSLEPDSKTRDGKPSGVTSYYATSSVRFQTLDMVDKSIRRIFKYYEKLRSRRSLWDWLQ
ncbi:hypothetical protein KQX54_003073 [Cotesia glomerata]|uniref:Uncharacterized protein n=1 Tax=Cotesia glomerata TaxID=32391 RepID=A0AAV7I0K0_COTGL|nr:hypothetical protein KQX54_003073 [Cotesia glomerata]